MKALVLNSGSSSLKYQLFQLPEETVLCSGLVDKIGQAGCVLKHKQNGQKVDFDLPDADHTEALNKVSKVLVSEEHGVIKSAQEVDVVGHRVVHGGEEFNTTTIINEKVKAKIKALFSLAPLHNPANLQGIDVAEEVFPSAKQIAVFDTAFHSNIPEHAYRYAIPNELYEKHGIRTYGFHGTSHRFVANKSKALFGIDPDKNKIVTIHLGNGCSMAAIKDNKCIDTTMGLGPLAGLVMGTRSGDIDPSVIFYLSEKGHDISDIRLILNKNSGLKGLTGESDMRAVKELADKGSSAAKLALDIYAYRIKKYIGAYTAALNGLDSIIFTGGVGENDADMRANVCAEMDALGIEINNEENAKWSDEARDVSNGKVKVLIIPTNEELEIATQCYRLITTGE
ncbi:acetate/propionate family kinase [Reichenbachiella versicolor]|uniref:acetate/propionate family kinase n=1 Tax=Reichenbachiella versicolor TaxID=1821036 RepID=UPI000D6DFF54|nr:acetate kinase [Reichenbachiella versicolor]